MLDLIATAIGSFLASFLGDVFYPRSGKERNPKK
jgi:hypothetical protein